MSPRDRLDLGGIDVDFANERLERDGEPIKLRPKAFALLCYLLDHPGRVITKDELLDEVWAGTVVGDSVLKVCVRELRVALGDDSKSPRFVETVHRRGYRFLVDVREQLRAALPSSPTPAPVPAPAPSPIGQPVASEPGGRNPLVAREEELESLRRTVERSIGGDRQLVFVTGDAGIGKTALVEALIESLPEGVRALRGRCLDQLATREAYLPFLELLDRLVRSEGELAKQRLRRIAPTWLVQLPWLLDAEDRRELGRELLGATSERMLREMAALLEDPDQPPLVLLLEDLHWSDGSTLDLLTFLAGRSEPARLCILATWRPIDVIADEHPLGAVARRLLIGGNATELALDLFDRRGVALWLEARLGDRSGAERAPLASWLHDHTDGHPLFLEHAFEALVEGGKVRLEGGTFTLATEPSQFGSLLPDSLRELILGRLEGRAEQRELLEAAALSGYEFSAAAVAAALDLAPEKLEELESRLDTLAEGDQFITASGILDLPGGQATARYRFRHAIVRAAIAAGLPAARRARMQLRLGRNAERALGDRIEDFAAEVAVHFEEGRDPARALHYRVLASKRETRRCAPSEATEHLRHALVATESLPPQDAAQARMEVLEALAAVARAAGNTEASVAACDEWCVLAREAGDVGREARGHLSAASSLSWVDRDRCLAAIERAARLAPSIDDELRSAHIASMVAYWQLMFKGDTERVGVVAAAVDLARRRAERSLLATHMTRLSFFHSLRGDHDRALDTAREGLDLVREAGEPSDLLVARFFLTWSAFQAGVLSEATEVVEAAIHDAERNGHRPWIALFKAQRAWLSCSTNALESALADILESLRISTGIDHPFGVTLGHAIHALVLIARDEPDAARAALAQARERLDGGRFLLDHVARLPFEAASASLAG